MHPFARFDLIAVTNDESFANDLVATDNYFVCLWARCDCEIGREFLFGYPDNQIEALLPWNFAAGLA